ncbi:hypothetical protein D9R19_03490 [Corynebacterium diphtheriae]|nr:hypothetical protein BGK40_03140 [Corynebacterium diphtheriae]RKW92896.1 hypothetical protein D9B36_03510 [Corynebacterium diphtheriae]RLP09990.1 hypothetical protein D9R17_04110 [Corynebacterium diphtheriae]RLP19431.1 hypothetical protein D9R19_03490 [Corynebacterium diphtheriae]
MPDKFTDNATAEAVQYSLGQPSVRTGLGGYSMKATIVAGVGFGVYLLFQLAGHAIMGLLVVLPITAIVAMMVTVKIGNRSLAENIQIRYLASKARKARENEYVSGAHSRVPGGRRRLPGLLARTEIVTGVDTRGAEFAAIVDKPRREITVLLDCQLTGQLAITQAMRNDVTAEWARWLAASAWPGTLNKPSWWWALGREPASWCTRKSNPSSPMMPRRSPRSSCTRPPRKYPSASRRTTATSH